MDQVSTDGSLWHLASCSHFHPVREYLFVLLYLRGFYLNYDFPCGISNILWHIYLGGWTCLPSLLACFLGKTIFALIWWVTFKRDLIFLGSWWTPEKKYNIAEFSWDLDLWHRKRNERHEASAVCQLSWKCLRILLPTAGLWHSFLNQEMCNTYSWK